MSIKAKILGPLLDKYERSAHFRKEARVNRRIMLTLKLPLYDIEDPTNKLAVHQVLEELQQKDLVKIHWLKGEEGNIVRQVQLNVKRVAACYREINRKDKLQELKATVELFQAFPPHHQWLIEFAKDTTEYIQTRYNLPPILPATHDQQLKLVTALKAIADLNEEMLERVFSKRVLGDSKYFEQHLRAKTASILKRYLLHEPNLDTDQVLQQVGLYKSSDELLFTGAIEVKFNGKTIDFQDFIYGAAISSRMASELEVTGFNGAEIVTIENKASYREFCSQLDIKKTTAIYLGGFPGPAKRSFLQKLYTHTQKNNLNVRFRHWGDIDLGGFRIFLATREVVPVLEPMLMDRETLLKHKDKGQPLSKNYRQQLEALLEDDKYAVFHEVVKVMLEEDLRLEQEGVDYIRS